MSKQEIIIPSKNVQIWLTYENITVKLDSSSRLSKTFTQTIDNIYGIGYEDPIGIVNSNAAYSTQLTLQTGEYQILLNAINGVLPAGAEMYASFLQVPVFGLSITYAMNDLIVPSTCTWTLNNCRVNEDSEDITANDPATYTTIGIQGTGITRRVAPIPSN